MTTPQAQPRRVLIVGSWAKAEITIEHLRAASDVEVFAYLEIANPGIVSRTDGHRIGDATDGVAVTRYATDERCDLVLVTTAAPLAAGVGDALAAADIPAFAPTRAAARLEWDKAFMRRLAAEHYPEAVPRFRVSDDATEAIGFAEELDWEVAVKPLGLTEGLGVKVFGDQLRKPRHVRAYIREVLEEGIGGSHRVLVEERLEGEEFTLQTLVDGEQLVPTPTVQDFKRLRPFDRGPNTAGMGSYAGPSHLLPFLPQALYDQGLDILQTTLEVMAGRGEPCRGFLYGQFMITAAGLKLIEYNFRPGDPEWMNTVATLDTPLLDAVTALAAGRTARLEFLPEASVVKYLVPEAYPAESGQILEVDLEPRRLAELGVSHYYSAGLDDEGRLDVGSERGIALVARAASIEEAHERIERAILGIGGRFRHRPDIGSAELVRAKIGRVADLLADDEVVRTVREDEFEEVEQFTACCEPLESYDSHEYKILLRYFGDTSYLIERDGEIAAFEMGFRSARDPGTYFLWQIGVAPDLQGEGLGARLLAHIEDRVAALGCRRIELTIDPENIPSRKLFERAGYRNVSRREGMEVIERHDRPAVVDYYGEGADFMLYEKRLQPADDGD